MEGVQRYSFNAKTITCQSGQFAMFENIIDDMRNRMCGIDDDSVFGNIFPRFVQMPYTRYSTLREQL